PVGGTYNQAMLDHDMAELIRYYRGFGYHDVRVYRELVPTPDGREVVVVFHVHEGVRYRVANTPSVEGVKSMPAEALESSVKMKGGKLYAQATIDGDLTRIKDWLGVQGRQAAAVAVPYFDKEQPGIVQVRYEVEERPPARVGQIFIV